MSKNYNAMNLLLQSSYSQFLNKKALDSLCTSPFVNVTKDDMLLHCFLISALTQVAKNVKRLNIYSDLHRGQSLCAG